MLGPMAEIASGVVHPTASKTIGELWQEFDRDAHPMAPVTIALPGRPNYRAPAGQLQPVGAARRCAGAAAPSHAPARCASQMRPGQSSGSSDHFSVSVKLRFSSARRISHSRRVQRGFRATPVVRNTQLCFETRRNVFNETIYQGESHHVQGAVHHRGWNRADQSGLTHRRQQSEELEEVVVTGLRGSLKASMDTKRDAVGVVDAINAEDIGKFPDTNLSEALQRITGVSIDRRNGEGATVTARGFGPQFNMVTLNGRQMPTADAFADGTATTGGLARQLAFVQLRESRRRIDQRGRGLQDRPRRCRHRRHRRLDQRAHRAARSTTTASCSTSASRRSTTPPIVSATISRRSCRASSAYAKRRQDVSASVCRPATQKRDSGSSTSTVNDWHIHPWNSDARRESQHHAAVREQQRHAVHLATDDIVDATVDQRAGERPALRHPERHPLRVLGFRA